MPSFEQDFIKSKGMSIKYKDVELIGADRIPVQKKFSGALKLISTNSEWRQAMCLAALDGKLSIFSQKEKRFIVWADDLKDEVLHFEGVSKSSQLLVYNAWENIAWNNMPFTNFWTHGAAMIVEVNGNTRRYRCNDGHPDDNFDDIIFEVTIDEPNAIL
ncbi:MAG: hypothetical protein LBH25_14840 [Fibromonadaceae bacterium]|jgi:hypothetical protein|nr:hypothetical protein [Fibromonadaceae bacterium]